jgi:hypothetical protein
MIASGLPHDISEPVQKLLSITGISAAPWRQQTVFNRPVGIGKCNETAGGTG